MVSAGEQGAFVQAVLDLKNLRPSIIADAQALGATSRYDDYVWMHLAAFSLIHLGPAFGPWHREVLRQFELDLRDVSGNPDICIPYWDWPTGRQPSDPDWPFRNDLMGGLGTGPGFAVQTGPFAGSTGDWPINVTDPGATHTVLRRVATTSPTSLSLPNATTSRNALNASPYDSVPYNDNNFPTNAQAAASFRKSIEFFLHNGPHNWVGNADPNFLDMMAASSPNDPIFFLHHAQVDRIWSVWQDRNPGIDHFLPLSGAFSGHNLGDVMDVMDGTYFNFPVLDTNAANVDLHAAGVWYDTDLPEVTLATPSVDFQQIPAGLTTYFPVQFSVEGCRAMRFTITGVGGSGFSIPPGQINVDVPATDDPSPRTVNVFVRCVAPADGSPLGPGSVSIDATVVDGDGYLSGTVGSTHVFGSYTATLSATVIQRLTSAVAFVSDRSGSMRGAAGAGLTKFELLEEALEVATDLLDAADSTALVFFDHAVMTPLSMSTVGGGGGVDAALADPSIQPQFGSTALGDGLIAGAAELGAYTPPPGVTNANLAIVCLTDGNENVAPYVTDPPVTAAISPYTSDLYAIGLGTENNVSAPTLGAISQYMLVTGDNAATHRRYLVTKYFVQILADIKRADIIVDPDGILYSGVTHDVPFDVSEADVEVELVVVSAAAPYLDFEVVTPGGDVLSKSAFGPNVHLEVNKLDAILRLRMPALPVSPATSHRGRWTLRLRIDDRLIGKLREHLAAAAVEGRVPAVEYSVVVLTRSNLSFDVGRTFPAIAPGDEMPLVASLSQYRVPLTTATVKAEVTGPLGSTSTYALAPDDRGRFVASIPAPSGGLYRCRVMASGVTMGGARFVRETTRTFAVGDPSAKPGTGRAGARPDLTCAILACVMRDPGIRRWLESNHVDIDGLRKCLDELCAPPREGPMSDRKDDVRQRSPQELKKLVQLAIRDQQAFDPLVAEKPSPVVHPQVDPAVYDAPMFMPALAWNDKGEVIVATTGKKPPPRGDRDIEVSRLAGISASAAAKLREAGFYTAGDMLDRPQPLAGILGVTKMQVKKLLEGARSGALKKANNKPVKKTVAKKKATKKKATKKKATKKKQ